jgi:hypothetical protein
MTLEALAFHRADFNLANRPAKDITGTEFHPVLQGGGTVRRLSARILADADNSIRFFVRESSPAMRRTPSGMSVPKAIAPAETIASR